MEVSFIVPALNEEQHIRRCIDSIRQLAQSAEARIGEIIVVDNYSQDRTAEIADELGCELRSSQRRVPGHARNLGAAIARGEIFAFVDADCELPVEWLARLVGHLADDNVCAVGAAMAGPGSAASWVERDWYALAHHRTKSVEEVPWLPSFNLMVRRDAFEAVGGFDESLVTGEDVDLGYRLADQGRLLADGGVSVTHYGESESLGQFFRREVWRGRGSLPGLMTHGIRLGELPSIALPAVFAMAIGVGIGALAASSTRPELIFLGASLLVLAVLLPVGIALYRRARLGRLLSSTLLVAVYLGARAVGLVWPGRRVARAVRDQRYFEQQSDGPGDFSKS